MLKVKDNVSHQKLNALGFYKNDWENSYDKETDYDCTISMDIENRLLTTYCFSGGYETVELESNDWTTIEQIEFLVPKMKDLVEAVS